MISYKNDYHESVLYHEFLANKYDDGGNDDVQD